jgi:hypothetical protein
MPEISVTHLIGILAVAANIGIALMIIILLGERSHAAWTRIGLQAGELVAVREHLQTQVNEAEAVIRDGRGDIDALRRQLQNVEADVESVQQRQKETDLPVGYVATPVDVVDRRYRTWRLVVRNPELGAEAGALSHPAYRWIEGRFYDVPAANMEMAIEAVQARFLARDGFTVEPARSRESDEALAAEVG